MYVWCLKIIFIYYSIMYILYVILINKSFGCKIKDSTLILRWYFFYFRYEFISLRFLIVVKNIWILFVINCIIRGFGLRNCFWFILGMFVECDGMYFWMVYFV